jgi:uncharacterized protein
MFTAFEDTVAEPLVRGFLHEPKEPNGDGVVLTHGAGGNCKAKLLVAVAEALAAGGFVVLRFDLPFRLARPFGPPRPSTAERDRAGVRRAAALCRDAALLRPKSAQSPQPAPCLTSPADAVTGLQTRALAAGAPPLVTKGGPSRIFLAGQSYGGRQASMLLAEDPEVADGLLLLSYPLHPPNKPQQLRSEHLPRLTKPSFFVHGTRDPFATSKELRTAVSLIPGRHEVLEVENAGHDLLVKKSVGELPEQIARQFAEFVK